MRLLSRYFGSQQKKKNQDNYLRGTCNATKEKVLVVVCELKIWWVRNWDWNLVKGCGNMMGGPTEISMTFVREVL